MMANLIPRIGIVLLATSLGLAAQSRPDSEVRKVIDYKLGQVWTLDQDSTTVTILAIEDIRKLGTVVHVRIDKIPWQSCGDVHLTRTIDHVAVTEKMMLMSGLALSKDKVDLPQSSVEAVRRWQGQKKHEIWKGTLSTLIHAQGYVSGPMNCDPFLLPT